MGIFESPFELPDDYSVNSTTQYILYKSISKNIFLIYFNILILADLFLLCVSCKGRGSTCNGSQIVLSFNLQRRLRIVFLLLNKVCKLIVFKYISLRWWQVPYFWLGIKAYDFVAGSQLLKPSYLLSKSRALELFPMLKRDKLKAALVYYDGR